MDIQKMINYWLEGSKKDMITVEVLFEGKQYPQCLFWGHLVIEKLLKAFIVKETQNQAPYSHDLVFLVSKTNLQLTKAQRDTLNEITTFNQFGRYDNEIADFEKKCTPEYTSKYFFLIKELYIWLTEFFQNKN